MRWLSKVGFGIAEHDSKTGKSRSVITEHEYYATVSKDMRQWQSNGTINDDLRLSNVITIYANGYALQHHDCIKYATYNNVYWKVTNVQVEFPEMTLFLGGVYNGVKA